MQKKDFHLILKDYLSRKATKEEKKLIDTWYADLGKDAHSSLNTQEEGELEERYWAGIDAHIKSGQKKRGSSRALWYPIGIAASVLLALVVVRFVFNYRTSGTAIPAPTKQESPLALKKVINTQATAQIVSLPDGSRVSLEPRSRLEFSESFVGSSREVFLEGEGFFEVARDVNRPFLVYANKVTTKVLGTSFTVKAFREESSVTVAVRTGRVSVYTSLENEAESRKTNEIILTPNQQIVYNKGNQKLSRMIVETPQLILPAEKVKRMRFEAAPVSEILEAIEKVYGLEIVFDRQKLASCTLTTSISDGGLYNRLDIICAAIGAAYTVKEDQIVIEGLGCNH